MTSAVWLYTLKPSPHLLLLLLCSGSVTWDSWQLQELQHTRFPCPSLSLRVCSNLYSLSQWCHPTISSSVALFSSCPQSFPASGSFQQVSSLHQVAKALELQLQHQSFQRIFRLISFRIDSSDLLVVQGTLKNRLQCHSSKHQFFGIHPFLKSSSHIHTWQLKKP